MRTVFLVSFVIAIALASYGWAQFGYPEPPYGPGAPPPPPAWQSAVWFRSLPPAIQHNYMAAYSDGFINDLFMEYAAYLHPVYHAQLQAYPPHVWPEVLDNMLHHQQYQQEMLRRRQEEYERFQMEMHRRQQEWMQRQQQWSRPRQTPAHASDDRPLVLKKSNQRLGNRPPQNEAEEKLQKSKEEFLETMSRHAREDLQRFLKAREEGDMEVMMEIYERWVGKANYGAPTKCKKCGQVYRRPPVGIIDYSMQCPKGGQHE